MPLASMIYMLIGIAITLAVLAINAKLFRHGGLTWLEAAYWVMALAGLIIGWHFNLQYIAEYGPRAGWAHWTGLLFVNPAAASGGQDLIIANVLIFPFWSIIEARRSAMRAGWLYFPVSLVTSYAFGLALFLAIRERQRRVG